MNDHERAPSSPDAARARLVAGLRASGRALSPPVQEAFARVPRHLFVPEMGQAAAYRDEAFVLKCGPDGVPAGPVVRGGTGEFGAAGIGDGAGACAAGLW